MRPGFLIIGAMKAGTTTLYADLRTVAGLYLPPEKEPEDLTSDTVLEAAGLQAYLAKFCDAPANALCGEASTAYSKRPTFEGVAERALRVCGPDLKVIYLLRDPIARIESQYRHEWGLGLEARPLKMAAFDSTYLGYSRYDWQLAPWRAVLPPEQILILRIEDYLADRQAGLNQMCAFLGVAAGQSGNEHLNASFGKRIARRGGLAERIMRAPLYQYHLKPYLPKALHRAGRRLLLQRTVQGGDVLTAVDRARLRRKLLADPIAGAYLS
ncbi:MAG: hypothetical protein ACI8TF_000912 [Paracoccaceae bacterium]|jgi:hypothetical protein